MRNIQANNNPTFVAFVDIQKAFEWVDRDLLMLKLLTNNIDGKIYNAIKSMYLSTISGIKINKKQSEWFICTSRVDQGDILSTTLFNIYINDLAKEIKDLNIGISIEDVKISIPMYADDIVLLAENEKDLHYFLDKLNEWCMKWKMQVNQSKTNVVHFIKEKSIQNKCIIYFRECRFKVVDRYRYVGI